MPKLTGVTVTATAALLLALTGCAGATETPTDAQSDAASNSPSPHAANTPAPLVAETPSPTSSNNTDAQFLGLIREALPDETQIPNATDAQLLEASQRACQALRDGQDPVTVSVIEGEQADSGGYFQDSIAILTTAVATVCPELKF